MTTISVTGTKELQMALDALGDDINDAVADVLNATGLELRGDIIKRIQHGPKTGRIYKRRSVTHQASAPGQAPATDTGRLANSVVFNKRVSGPNKGTVVVESFASYAKYLEFGTRKIAPRPAWAPAALAAEPKFRKRLEAVIAGAIR